MDAPSAAWRRTLRAMSDQMARFRDARGRVTSLGALLGFTLAGLVTGVAALVVIDAVTALLGRGDFGHANGWLAVVLPVWLFILEELRAWRGVTGRLVLAGSGLLVGLALGLVAANAVAELPPLGSGAVGAAVASLAYAVYWYHGIRWLARREGEIS